MPQYFSLLGGLYGFHRPLESALKSVPISVRGAIDLEAREKSQLLHADLMVIGTSEREIHALTLSRYVPEIKSRGSLIGCLYVIEGAGLGGGVMARKLDSLLGSESIYGRQFFLGRPNPDPLPWDVYCKLLESCTTGTLDDAVAGARNTFDAFERWLNESGEDV